MSTQEAPQGGTTESDGMGRSSAEGGPSEDDRSEIDQRAAYEAELSRITSADMVLQATVSLLNIGARRLGLVGGPGGADSGAQQSPERDLEQVRDAIDAVRGLMPVIERRAPEEARALRDALSQLQMAYAREAQGSAPAQTTAGEQAPPAGAPGAGGPQSAPAGQPATEQPPAGRPDGKSGPGPAESSGRLWVPGR